MPTTALRYYKSTLAYTTTERERRIRDVRKHLQTRISRRKFRQALQNTLRRFERV